MNYQKLDAALSLELSRVERSPEGRFAVFIYTQSISVAEATANLERLGAENASGSQNIVTATLSAREVSEVSEKSWVKYVRLSQVLYPVNYRY